MIRVFTMDILVAIAGCGASSNEETKQSGPPPTPCDRRPRTNAMFGCRRSRRTPMARQRATATRQKAPATTYCEGRACSATCRRCELPRGRRAAGWRRRGRLGSSRTFAKQRVGQPANTRYQHSFLSDCWQTRRASAEKHAPSAGVFPLRYKSESSGSPLRATASHALANRLFAIRSRTASR